MIYKSWERRKGENIMGKFCPICGAEIKGNSKFCAGCGSSVQGNNLTTVRNNKKIISKGINLKKIKTTVILIVIVMVLIFGGNLIVKRNQGKSYKEPFKTLEEGINTQNLDMIKSACVEEYAQEFAEILNRGMEVQIDVLGAEDYVEGEMSESELRSMKEIGSDKAKYVGVKITLWSADRKERETMLKKMLVLRIDKKWYLAR